MDLREDLLRGIYAYGCGLRVCVRVFIVCSAVFIYAYVCGLRACVHVFIVCSAVFVFCVTPTGAVCFCGHETALRLLLLICSAVFRVHTCVHVFIVCYAVFVFVFVLRLRVRTCVFIVCNAVFVFCMSLSIHHGCGTNDRWISIPPIPTTDPPHPPKSS